MIYALKKHYFSAHEGKGLSSELPKDALKDLLKAKPKEKLSKPKSPNSNNNFLITKKNANDTAHIIINLAAGQRNIYSTGINQFVNYANFGTYLQIYTFTNVMSTMKCCIM